MNTEYFLIFLVIITALLLIIQRTDPNKRRLVIFVMLLPALLLRNFANYRDVSSEALTALWVAIFLNVMFWLLIGRYNPPRSSDEIKVLGLDD